MTSPDLYLDLLGPFEVRLEDERVVDLRLRTARLLLSWLVLRPRQSGSREEIAALLWSERGEAQARQSLRQTLAVLRRSPIDKALQVDRERLEFVPGAVHSDVAALLAVGADSAVAELERAVAQYRGEFLEGLSIRDPLGQNWLEARRAELRALAIKRFEWLLTAYERAGRHDAAEPVAVRLLDVDPLAEAGHRALIRLHLAAGQRALAVRQYQRCRDILARELGVEPAEETRALLRVTSGPAADQVAEVREQPLGRTQLAHNLPRQLTSLVGRDREVEDVLARLNRYRLVTLTGPGGAGKTRMAVETGFRLAGGYADGVWLVELASIADPNLIGEALCGALGVPVAGDRPAVASAIAHLNQREVLLILDNCEHLVAASAKLVEMLLGACPDVSILVTSRESLSVSGESLYRVPGLDYPDRIEAISPTAAVNFSAVQLFVDRAAAIVEGFTLDDANTPAIASICRQVDGIPLAIELAVGRLKMMGPDWLAANLSASFLTLRRSSRAGPKHHQTLRGMLDWSYDLLEPEEQALLRRLAVFAGGCTLASAMRVASGAPIAEDQVFDLLSSLVEKSLVAVDVTAAEPRYRLLETTRSYALDKQREIGEPGRQRQLADYLVERFTEAGDTWPRTPTLTWLGRYEPELDNVRAALEWAFGREGDAALGVALATLNIRLWDELSLFRERGRWSELAMQRIDETAPPAIAARLHLARTSNSAHGDASGFSYADQAVQLFRSADRMLDLGEALGRAGAALLTMETIGKALPYLEDALKVLEPLGPTKPLASCLRSKGVAAYLGGDIQAARTLIGRSMAVCHSVGDIRGVASAQIALAEMDFIAGEVASAIDGIRRMLGGTDHNRRQATLGLANLASYLLSDGNTALARQAAGESLREARALAWPGAIVRASEHLALVAALEGEAELAARLLGFTEAFYTKGSASREWTEQVTHQRLVAELARQLSPARLSDRMAEGAGWSEVQAIEAASAAGEVRH
ncbi:MAG TPA: BTAD domain-containing putative transcriptional regulator [Devosia sp.]|uniref:ATP-binding protein n=1 Tax=Devosia sp. TaxID=1871048 RepID=UPI002DDD053C|nr:BTAD domain-containing putative transcriptional regulator [Devosia sp.]HEV2517320.1 BTAD domain-containing putative transcriptional regulator [Devosia sp.]